eukprot:1370423-Prymnesium_polylepis.1
MNDPTGLQGLNDNYTMRRRSARSHTRHTHNLSRDYSVTHSHRDRTRRKTKSFAPPSREAAHQSSTFLVFLFLATPSFGASFGAAAASGAATFAAFGDAASRKQCGILCA